MDGNWKRLMRINENVREVIRFSMKKVGREELEGGSEGYGFVFVYFREYYLFRLYCVVRK